MTISISIDRILEQVYALSALDRITSGRIADPHLAVLSSDNRPALQHVVRDAVAHIGLMLSSRAGIVKISVPDNADDGGLVRLDIDGSLDRGIAPLLRQQLEQAIVMYTFHLIYIPFSPGSAEAMHSRACSALSTVLSVLMSHNPPRLSLNIY